MKYTCSIEIKAPLEKVVKLWANEKNFHRWQDGFEKIELIKGVKGEKGSKSKIFLNDGKRKMELLETIQINNLPIEKTALYEHIHMSNTQTSRFKAIENGLTLYTSEVEYIKFTGFLPKLMSMLFPGMFKKQSQKWMNQFKAFAEQN